MKKRVVLVPYPFQGHMTPMLQLASLLHSHGCFSITIAHTQFNSPDPSLHPSFTFLPLPDGLHAYDTSFYNTLNAISVMNNSCQAPFRDSMVKMLQEEGNDVCIIYDTIMKFVAAVGSELNIPMILLRTTTAAYMHSHNILFRLIEQKIIPVPESELEVPIEEAYPLRFKDLPSPSTQEIPEVVVEFLHSFMDIKLSSAVIWNTVEPLDRWALEKLNQDHWKVPFFSIGPLHKMAQPLLPTSLLEEDDSCLSWLDTQSPNSVLYVSLGSLAIIDEDELVEMARGIAKSDHPFLWAMRPSLLGGSDPMKSLPQDFKELAQDRGRIVNWAPQKKVLAHKAVGGFLTHCGWNSTLEAICEGVPLICRPCFSDQVVNARYLSYVWEVGVELESTTESGYERAINTLMGNPSGKIMRQNVLKLKQEMEHSINGGASHHSFLQLVDFILSMKPRN